MRASDDQKARTKSSEGFRNIAYLDSAGHWAVGWGHDQSNPRPVRGLKKGEFYQGPAAEDVEITPAEGERLFAADWDEVECRVSAEVQHDLTQGQLDSLCDFVFQYGIEHFRQSALLRKVRMNPNNLGPPQTPETGILWEFERWNIAGGHRDKGVYMRACRRACVYAGAPIPQVLWQSRDFPWCVTPAPEDEIDHSVTPTAHQLVEMGRKGLEKPKFSPDAPLTPPAAKPSPAPLQTPANAKPEIILDKPLQTPAPSLSPAGAGEAAAKPASNPAPPPPILPRPQAPPLPSQAQQESAVNAANRSGVDWDNPKSMILSRRFWGIVLLLGARVWFWKTGADDAIKAASDPLMQEVFAGIVVMMLTMLLAECGHFLHWYGSRHAKRPIA